MSKGRLKKFASANKRAPRVNPKKCYTPKTPIYGAPGANHEWGMLFQSAHVKTRGLTLSEVEPSLYVKIVVDDSGCVKDWLICKIWTDDVRYFGTDTLRMEYEKLISKSIKVKFLGVPKEFVGTEMIQDLENGICVLKAPKYWEAAALKFLHLYPNGLKHRRNPLSVTDEKVMEEVVSGDEHEKAKHLP